MRENWSKLPQQGRQAFESPEPGAFTTGLKSVFAHPPQTHRLDIPTYDLLAQFEGRGHLLLGDEAVHRAKNLAQLANAVVYLRLVKGRKLVDAEHLAKAYGEVGDVESGSDPAPCADLLRRVSVGLAALFRNADRDVALDVEAAEVVLTPDRRRALLLIASELVINALRHAFPGDRPGSVLVSLRADGGSAVLAVEDDGVGCSGAFSGQGSRILDGLTAMLGGTLSRGPSTFGGLGVYVLFRAEA